MIVISSEHGFPYPEPVGLVYRNCVLLDRETRFETLARILDLIGSLRQIGARLSLPIMLAMLPQPYGKMGDAEEGLILIDDTLNEMEQTSEYQMQAEFHRLKEELMLLQTASNAVEAERSFRTAIDIARSQEAKSLELRATTSLARLLAKQGRRDEARAMLAEIYNWFTEGFDTADLKDAKALLEQP